MKYIVSKLNSICWVKTYMLCNKSHKVIIYQKEMVWIARKSVMFVLGINKILILVVTIKFKSLVIGLCWWIRICLIFRRDSLADLKQAKRIEYKNNLHKQNCNNRVQHTTKALMKWYKNFITGCFIVYFDI